MGYRRYNRRYSRAYDESIIEVLADMFIALVAASIRMVLRVVRWMWRKLAGPRPAQTTRSAHTPPHLPSIPACADAPQVKLPQVKLPYRKAPHLLSKGERALWYPLYRAVKGKYRIFCKARLADVVSCPDHRIDERYWFRKIGRYHLDFVLCDPETTAPLLVIELDDRRHRMRSRKERDDFKDDVLRAAGLSVYRIPAQQAYDPVELSRDIERLINEQSAR